MKKLSTIAATVCALAVALPASSAMALNARSFVSPTGSDSNDCSLAAPCRTFQAALDATNAGGEISVLGTAGYGTLTINKAISIVNPGGFEAGVIVPSGGIGISVDAGEFDAVSLRGLSIEGAGIGSYGIRFNTGASLTVDNCVIRRLAAHGIYFTPNVPSKLSVSHSLVANNGSVGIYIDPTASFTVRAVFNRVETNNNGDSGIFMDGRYSTGTIMGTVVDSVAASNNHGFYVQTSAGHAPTTLMLFHSVAANNGSYGVAANGSGATVRLDQSMLTANLIGWIATSSGSILSYGNNAIDGNLGGGETAPPPTNLK